MLLSFGGLCWYHENAIKIIQKHFIKIIYFKSKDDSTFPILYELKILFLFSNKLFVWIYVDAYVVYLC